MRALIIHPMSLLVIAGALWGAGGCTPYQRDNAPPVAVAGDDQTLEGSSVTVRLDGSDSYDMDGKIVGWQWRYTGMPVEELALGTIAFVDENADAGVEDDLDDYLKPRPEFCGEVDDPEMEILLPERYCFLDDGEGGATGAKTSVELTPGRYRFTLWVFDEDGDAGDDSLIVVVAP